MSATHSLKEQRQQDQINAMMKNAARFPRNQEGIFFRYNTVIKFFIGSNIIRIALLQFEYTFDEVPTSGVYSYYVLHAHHPFGLLLSDICSVAMEGAGLG
jgi:hypothetical protein